MSSRDNNIKSNDSHEPKSSSHDDSRIPSAEVVNSEDDINARLESDCRIRDDDSDAVPVEESNNDSGQTSIWIIDEQYLKDIDKDLTEEEKQVTRKDNKNIMFLNVFREV